MSKEKVVLAYSGGLDTSVCVKWLQDEKNLDVVCVCGNVGQEETGLMPRSRRRLTWAFSIARCSTCATSSPMSS